MEKSVKLFPVELRDEAISLQRLSFRLQLCEGWNWVLYEWWRQVNCSTRCKNLSHHCHKLWLGAGKDSIYCLDFNFDHAYFINLYAEFSSSISKIEFGICVRCWLLDHETCDFSQAKITIVKSWRNTQNDNYFHSNGSQHSILSIFGQNSTSVHIAPIG